MADSFSQSADRHRTDAKHLAEDGRFQNAGHLIGFAAECLVKELLHRAGIPIDRASGLREHFPHLAAVIRVKGYGRLMTPILPTLSRPNFLMGWKAELRYEATVPPADAEDRWHKWITDVDGMFNAAGIL